MGVNLFKQFETILEGEPLVRVLATPPPVVLDLAGPRQRVERHALEVRVIEPSPNVERPLRTCIGGGNLCFCGEPAGTANPKHEKSFGREVGGQNPLIS